LDIKELFTHTHSLKYKKAQTQPKGYSIVVRCQIFDYHQRAGYRPRANSNPLMHSKRTVLLPPYCGRDSLAYAYDAQRVIGWGCFLEGSLAKNWLTVQDTYSILIGSRKTTSVWARKLIKQLWKAAFRLCWLHHYSWQHRTENPQHKRAIVDLDKQITVNYVWGTAAVQPKHHHIFKLSLLQRLQTPLLDKSGLSSTMGCPVGFAQPAQLMQVCCREA
jgi:hypothetical protein